jgi:hypothetical protein
MTARAADCRNVLFVSSNGVGLGHLSRQLAVARRLAEGQRAVFHTLSYAAFSVARSGYLCFTTQHHRSTGMEQAQWNRTLGEDYCGLIAALAPKAFVHDATAVFGGTVEALSRYPELPSVWIRRPMWRAVHERFLQHSRLFTTVVEPGELAEALDDGPTRALRAETLRVSPVLHIDPQERLGRDEARKALGLPNAGTVVCLQLSGQTDERIRNAVLDQVLADPDVVVIEVCSPLQGGGRMSAHPRLYRASLYPAFLYSRAWDAAISSAGYNAFHENVIGAVPTLFVPLEGEEMDRQELRAQWAQAQGCGISLQGGASPQQIGSAVDRLLDRTEREHIAARCGMTAWTNGAMTIARHIDTLA